VRFTIALSLEAVQSPFNNFTEPPFHDSYPQNKAKYPDFLLSSPAAFVYANSLNKGSNVVTPQVSTTSTIYGTCVTRCLHRINMRYSYYNFFSSTSTLTMVDTHHACEENGQYHACYVRQWSRGYVELFVIYKEKAHSKEKSASA